MNALVKTTLGLFLLFATVQAHAQFKFKTVNGVLNYREGAGVYSPVVPLTTQVSITSGGSSTLSNAAGTIEVYIDPSAKLSTYALTLPAAPVDNQRVTIHFGGVITSGIVVDNFSIVPNTGQSLRQATTPSSSESGEAASLMYRLSNTTWYRSY